MSKRFVLDTDNINPIVEESIRRLIRRAKWAHTVDIVMRIDGKDERIEADWLKYLEEIQ